jgi:pyruvate dehydrogenase E1 component alpha subunit/2-oxoisovalerate dehydrogenase E1 component alpha subunit
LLSLLGTDGVAAPGAPLDGATRRELYRHMRRIRALDERMTLLQRQGRIAFYGSCTGQEAVPVACAFALAPGDWVFPALRESTVLLVRGFSLDRYVAQVFGNSLDLAKGRQMPSHMSAREANVVSWSSAIGTQLPHAAGAAWAAKILRRPEVAVGFLGDGATSTPDFHSALNFAGVFRLPCVFVCQNNHYAISLGAGRQSASPTLAVKAEGYGMPGLRVDGNDVLAVYEAVRKAAETARGGGGPTFIECVTYRIGPHSSSDDPSRYRRPAEVELWRARDPILRLKRHLLSLGLLDEATDAELGAELESELDATLARVEPASPPAVETLFDDVYKRRPWHLEEQYRSARPRPAPSHRSDRDRRDQ